MSRGDGGYSVFRLYIAHLRTTVSQLKMCDFSGETFNPLNTELNPICQ